jgi:hypothetical protein
MWNRKSGEEKIRRVGEEGQQRTSSGRRRKICAAADTECSETAKRRSAITKTALIERTAAEERRPAETAKYVAEQQQRKTKTDLIRPTA